MTIAVTRITHSCHVIEIGGLVLLTDPWFSQREHFHQGEPIALGVADLPDLDAVLISHDHYDHCDLDELKHYRNLAVPLLVAESVVRPARAAGFTDVRALTPWQSATIRDVVITATPAAHAVPEVTFVVAAGNERVFFGGDTLFIPELTEITGKLGRIDLALLPINGLRVRAQFEMQVVMDARQAAQLTAILRPRLAVPHHYAFTSGPVGDLTITKSERNPQSFVDAVREFDPTIAVRVAVPGERIEL